MLVTQAHDAAPAAPDSCVVRRVRIALRVLDARLNQEADYEHGREPRLPEDRGLRQAAHLAQLLECLAGASYSAAAFSAAPSVVTRTVLRADLVDVAARAVEWIEHLEASAPADEDAPALVRDVDE